MDILPNEDLYTGLRRKALFKQDIYQMTKKTFQMFKDTFKQMEAEFNERSVGMPNVEFSYTEYNDFKIKVSFGSDTIILLMHTNIFEFSRNHEVMRTQYINEKKERSYCGMIMIYNYLSDSFKYDRVNDLGYMVGRIFINCENHYYIEGKRELGQLYNNFSSCIITPEKVREICESAIRYTVNFDLLIPPYEVFKTVSVAEMNDDFMNAKMLTAKRLGYRFQADED